MHKSRENNIIAFPLAVDNLKCRMLPAAVKSTLIRERQRLIGSGYERAPSYLAICVSGLQALDWPGPGRRKVSWGPAIAYPS